MALRFNPFTGQLDFNGVVSHSFTIWQCPSGTSPTAATATDTMTLTSSDGTVAISGNSTTDTIDFTINAASTTSHLSVFTGDTGSGGAKGLVPAPAAGDAAAGKVLGASGGFINPSVSWPIVSPDNKSVYFSTNGIISLGGQDSSSSFPASYVQQGITGINNGFWFGVNTDGGGGHGPAANFAFDVPNNILFLRNNSYFDNGVAKSPSGASRPASGIAIGPNSHAGFAFQAADAAAYQETQTWRSILSVVPVSESDTRITLGNPASADIYGANSIYFGSTQNGNIANSGSGGGSGLHIYTGGSSKLFYIGLGTEAGGASNAFAFDTDGSIHQWDEASGLGGTSDSGTWGYDTTIRGSNNTYASGTGNGTKAILKGGSATGAGSTGNGANAEIIGGTSVGGTPGSVVIKTGNSSAAAITVDPSQKTTLSGTVVLAASHTPSSATDTGTAGTVTWDANYIYVCTATNTWKRAALASW